MASSASSSEGEDGSNVVVDLVQGCCVDPLARIWQQGDWQVKLSFLGVALLVLLWAAIAAAWSFWGTTIAQAFHERDMVLSLSRTNSNMGSERSGSERSGSGQSVDDGSFCSTLLISEESEESKKEQ